MDDSNQLPFKEYFPQLSNLSYFWIWVFIIALAASIGGYSVGVRVDQLPSSQYFKQTSSQIAQYPQAPVASTLSGTPIPGDDGDIDYAQVNGTFTTNTSYYDQFIVYIDQWSNGARTGQKFDYRLITKPQVGVAYPFSFLLLDPTISYILTTSACHTNTKGYALVCAKNVRITKCTGTIIGQGSSCIIPASLNPNSMTSGGTVAYSLSSKDNPIPKAIPTEPVKD